jgi:2-C-methyl-D-erythritol 4-phosphate cytidylyltransferase
MNQFQYAAVIVAGGTGTRMGGNIPKQFLLLDGVPIIVHTLKRFLHFDANLKVALVLHISCKEEWYEIAANYLSDAENERISVCEGGKERTDSVWNGLLCLENIFRNTYLPIIVGIHDAVRPFLTRRMLGECYKTAEQRQAVIPALPVKFSLRKRTSENTSEPTNRMEYLEVQTPQVFDFQLLFDAYKNRKADNYTDDAGLFQVETNFAVYDVKGDYNNIKITTPEDLFVAERILENWQENE